MRSSGDTKTYTCLVKLKYNPANIGSIHVWNPKRRIFQTLPCTDPEVEGVGEWQASVVQRWVREEQGVTKARERELRCALYEKIRGLTSAGTHKRIQRNEARLLSSPKVHEVMSEHLRVPALFEVSDGVVGRVSRLLQVALEAALRRDAQCLERADISWGIDHWAVPQSFIKANPLIGATYG